MPLITPHLFDIPYTTRPVPRDLIPPSSTTPSEAAAEVAEETPAATATNINDADHEKIHILWVGCSDSSILETDVLDVPRDEMFVHRNLGHVLSNGDLSTMSALEWCVELLKVGGIPHSHSWPGLLKFFAATERGEARRGIGSISNLENLGDQTGLDIVGKGADS